MKEKTTIVLVDDHLLIAKAIAGIIDGFENFRVLYECESGKQLLEKLSFQKNIPQVILLDISMPDMDGFEVANWLRLNHPGILVMALTMQTDDDAVLKMIKAGAKGYLHKNVHPAELEKALLSLVEKRFYYPDWATSKVLYNISNISHGSGNTDIHLTEKEKTFLMLACTDFTYREIAEKMDCSPRTVESYRDALFEKLNVRSRVALALYAVKIGLYKL